MPDAPSQPTAAREPWPSLPYEAWKDTYAPLPIGTQTVCKNRLAQTPGINHSRHATLYVTARGLTTSRIPFGARAVQIDFDFVDHRLTITTSDGARRAVELRPRS